MPWSKNIYNKLKEIKKIILKKKILLSLIINSYSWYDRFYRWSHMGLAMAIPVVALVQQTAQDVGASNIAVIIMGCVVASMLKIKEYIPYDKVKDVAKEQTLKYGNLYDQIERELLKSDATRQEEDDFFFWISREFNTIEVSDPEIEEDVKRDYIKMCKDKGIPYDDDINALDLLLMEKSGYYRNTTEYILDVKEENKPSEGKEGISKIESDKVEDNQGSNIKDNDKVEENKPSEVKEGIIKESNKGDNELQQSYLNQSYATLPNVHKVYSLHTDPRKLVEMKKSELKSDRERYKQTLQNINTEADISWAMERLSALE